MSHNERTFSGHKKILDFWRLQEKMIGRRVGRSKDEGILGGEGERWRVRKEIQDVLEVIKTNEERLGEKCWEVNLRIYDEQVRREKRMRGGCGRWGGGERVRWEEEVGGEEGVRGYGWGYNYAISKHLLINKGKIE